MSFKKVKHFFAILRIDEFQGNEVPLTDKIKVVKIVENLYEAKTEVDRLSKLNNSKGCTYFYQSARFDLTKDK